MEKMTYAEYLQENLGILPISECFEVLDRAVQGEMSDFEVEQELTPVVGTILSDLFNNDRETFDYVLEKINNAAEAIRQRKEDITFKLQPCDDSLDLVQQSEAIFNLIRDGYSLGDHWLDEDGVLIVILNKQG